MDVHARKFTWRLVERTAARPMDTRLSDLCLPLEGDVL